MSRSTRALIVLLVGVAVLVVSAATGLGALVQVFGGFLALIGAAGLTRVRFKGMMRLLGSEASASVEPDGDVGFDPVAEARDRGMLPQGQADGAKDENGQAPRTKPTGSSADSSPGPE